MYTPEFRVEAVRLIIEKGYKTAEAARNLGIHPRLLNRRKHQDALEGKKAFPGKRGAAKALQEKPTAEERA